MSMAVEFSLLSGPVVVLTVHKTLKIFYKA